MYTIYITCVCVYTSRTKRTLFYHIFNYPAFSFTAINIFMPKFLLTSLMGWVPQVKL